MTKDRISGPGRSPGDRTFILKWRNTSGESIPAYACIKLESYDAATDCFNAVKPDGEGDIHFVNGPVAVAVNAYGGSVLWDRSHIGLTSSVTFGAMVGPVAGSWEFGEAGSGFVVFSTPSGGEAAILQVGGGGTGGHHIWFTIDTVICNDDLTKTLTVTPIWYTGGCEATIPGADIYGSVEVDDPCSILEFYTAEWLASGGIVGRATYMYPRTGTCTPRWLVDEICGTPECA